MFDSNNLPNAISHKKLSRLFSSAKKDLLVSNDFINTEEEDFLDSLDEWEKLSTELIKSISNKSDDFLKNKSSNSIMAIGAMEAHLTMAIQALKVFKNGPNK